MSELQGELDRLERLLIETIALANPAQPVKGGSSTVTINAGGAGVWIAVTCCMVMAAALAIAVPVAVGAYLASQQQLQELREKDEILQAYISNLNVQKQDKPQ